ncbi:c-type cytochrome [Pseudomonas phoenicis]|uniref:c-type cytochrome n=1 Tax=unclassified Pseudomonas TaxID=196821 RepID=UPI0039A19A85
MYKRFTAVLCVAVVLCGCERVDPDSPSNLRKAIFKDMLRTSERLGGMLRGRVAFDGQAFGEGATRLDTLARQPWQHFPPPAEGERSNAQPAVWQRQARFADLARQLEAATAALHGQSQHRPLRAGELQAPMDAVEQACTACHREFRNH